MARKSITHTILDKAKPGERVEVWDTLLPGFGVRLSGPKRASFFVMYRVHDRQRRMTLGRYPVLSLADAREKARAALQQAKEGIDPAHEMKARKATRPKVFEEVLDDYLKRHVDRSHKRPEQTRWVFEKHIRGHWHDRPLGSITKADVMERTDALVAEGKGTMANRVAEALSAFFTWCMRRDLIDANPCYRMQRPAVETARDRVLSDDELVKVWQACATIGWPGGPMVQLLMLTGQRLQEVAAVVRPEIDADAKLWTLPRERTKSDRENVVPLSDLTLEILESVPKIDGSEFVFASRGKKHGHIVTYSQIKRQIDSQIAKDNEGKPLAPWRFHDLRRTVASGMARLGIAPHVVEKVLNHTAGEIRGVAAVYNRYAYTDEKRGALDAWARHIEALLGRGRDNVVPMRPVG